MRGGRSRGCPAGGAAVLAHGVPRSPVADADGPWRVAGLPAHNAPLELQPLVPPAALLERHRLCAHGRRQPVGSAPTAWHPASPCPYPRSPGWTAPRCRLRREQQGGGCSGVATSTPRGRGGSAGPGLTAGLDGAVVKGHAGVHGVAPGAVAVVVGVAAVVLLQVGLGVGGGRDPAGRVSPPLSPSPWPCRSPREAPAHTHWGTWGVRASQRWHVMPLRVLLTWPRYVSPWPW